MERKSLIGVALCLSGVSSALQAGIFKEEREGLNTAQSIIFTLPLVGDELKGFVERLPEQTDPKGNVWGAQPFWKNIPELWTVLANAELDGHSAVALKAASEEESTAQNWIQNHLQYGGNFWDSLKRDGALMKFIAALRGPIWSVVYDVKKKGFTPFGNNLHKAYGQSLVSYMGFYHIDERQKSLACELLNSFFGKKGTAFSGTSLGWIPEHVEVLYFMLLDLQLLYELKYGKCARTYNSELLENLIHIARLFFVHHLVRFHESLGEAKRSQEIADANPFGESSSDTGIPVFTE
ncbi:MAG: hypothetical protein LBD40_01765 [Puniceicoccales bacterium]|jgi:hypothetical protein|nr:hypothetical protein [Puniceicoccales bacterium]